MITRFLTDVSTRFNPFSPFGKVPRLFLAQLPPNARSTMKINVQQLPRSSQEENTLKVTFKDGKEMTLDVQSMGIKDVIEEINRHSRLLRRQEELSGG